MTKLNKKITLYGLTMIAVGSCIGSGIFVTPADVATAVPHHLLILLVWVIGGVFTLTGALTFAELGGMFPKSGGVYVFLKEAYGDIAGFLYGWVILLVINTGALAALGVAFTEYLKFFIPNMTESMKIAISIFTITSLTALNIFGVNISQVFANIFTGLKLAAIAAIIVAGIIFFEPENVQLNFSLAEGLPDNLIGALLVGLIGVLWSFGGWHHASYLAGETINAQKNVPRAMILGALIVTVTYVLINLAYMLLLPIPAIAGTERVAGDAIATLIPWGGKLVAIAIAISIFGTIGIYTMTAPRIYFAMARDGIFFEKLAYVHPTFRTPIFAMALQVAWATVVLLAWDGLFGKIITYVTFMDIVFMTLAGASVFIFRKKRKDADRPYKVWGYPLVPGIFVGIAGAFVVNTLIERPIQALAGLALLAVGVGVFWWFKNRK